MKLSPSIDGSKPRLYYLDWLRVWAIIGIFFFHNARFYDAFSDWHVRNATTNLGASILVGFMSQWIMPLFFLIAGAGTYYALGTRTAGQFIKDRILRLLVPLIFGMLVIVMPQAYFQALYQGVNLEGYNFFQIYGLYLKTLPDLNWFHLWYLAFLFVFSMVTVPIFIKINRAGESTATIFAKTFTKPWTLLLLFILLLAVVNIFIYPEGFWGNRGSGGWNILSNLLFYICGYLMFANSRCVETVKKLGWIIPSIGIIAMAVLLAFFFDEIKNPQIHFGSIKFAASQVIQALNAWAWVLAFLNLASGFMKNNNKFLNYANEAVLPFYILHQTVIIVIGFYVVQWNTGIGLKYLTVSTTSFIAIMLIYEFVVRRINAVRFLFGMKLNQPKMKIKPVIETGEGSKSG